MKTTVLIGFLLYLHLSAPAQQAAADTNVNAVLNEAWYSQGWFWIILAIIVVILMGIFVRNRKNKWIDDNPKRPNP